MSPHLRLAALALVLATATGCGGESASSDDSSGAATAVTSSSAATESATASETVAPADVGVLGEPAGFEPGAEADAIEVSVSGRECVTSEPLFGSCRAATGAGGAFVVTAEGDPDSPSEWTLVARCGLAPAVPGAAASGSFTPVLADLALAPYGELAGVTMLGAEDAVAALVYQPQGATCPVVWGLGEIDRGSIFTGGTDALNGEESPLRFRSADGAEACAVADGQGGISVGVPDDAECRV
jgi:hypothetical protein